MIVPFLIAMAFILLSIERPVAILLIELLLLAIVSLHAILISYVPLSFFSLMFCKSSQLLVKWLSTNHRLIILFQLRCLLSISFIILKQISALWRSSLDIY